MYQRDIRAGMFHGGDRRGLFHFSAKSNFMDPNPRTFSRKKKDDRGWRFHSAKHIYALEEPSYCGRVH